MNEWITTEEVDMLRDIAENIRQRSEFVGYGYFPGGDPRDFTPDHESCTEKEIAAWERACKLFEEKEISGASGQHHWPISDKDGNAIGWTTASPFGVGTYTMKDPDAERLVDYLDRWIDVVIKQGRHAAEMLGAPPEDDALEPGHE